ncbi:MAG: xylose isomerase, partial [Paracoccaceae bacterium]
MTDFFKGIPKIRYEGADSQNEFSFRHYNPNEVVAGKRMEDHLRFSVAYWHSFAWQGGDPFGGQTFQRPWFGETMALAKLKADVAFEMFDILDAPFYAFHDADARPEGATFAESKRNLEEIVDYIAAKQEGSKTRL